MKLEIISKRIARLRCLWLTLIILAIWEAEARRMVVQGHPRQIVHETLISKITKAI
jgi:hypothetical protein